MLSRIKELRNKVNVLKMGRFRWLLHAGLVPLPKSIYDTVETNKKPRYESCFYDDARKYHNKVFIEVECEKNKTEKPKDGIIVPSGKLSPKDEKLFYKFVSVRINAGYKPKDVFEFMRANGMLKTAHHEKRAKIIIKLCIKKKAIEDSMKF